MINEKERGEKRENNEEEGFDKRSDLFASKQCEYEALTELRLGRLRMQYARLQRDERVVHQVCVLAIDRLLQRELQ
jgi:hypothetical protein